MKPGSHGESSAENKNYKDNTNIIYKIKKTKKTKKKKNIKKTKKKRK